MSKELIQLQTANMFQSALDGISADWLVRENLTDKVLAAFPRELSDKTMFAIIHFAREFELKAFNAGISFAKEQKLKGFDPKTPSNLTITKEAK